MLFKLKYIGAFGIPGSDGTCIITLTDEEEKRSLAIVTQKYIAYQLKEIVEGGAEAEMNVVTLLWKKLSRRAEASDFRIRLDGVKDLGFKAVLIDKYTNEEMPLKPDHAVLLSLVSNIEMCCSLDVLKYLSTPFDKGVTQIALPILALPDPMLKQALDQAVLEENYETASFIRDEMKRREKQKDSLL